MDFQSNWDSTRPYIEFRKAQDEKIVECLTLEMSSIGKLVRQIEGCDPLMLDTKIE